MWPAYLMLEFVQAFEGLPILFSRWMKPELAAVNGKVAGNEGEKNLLVGVREGQVPIQLVFTNHGAVSCLLTVAGFVRWLLRALQECLERRANAGPKGKVKIQRMLLKEYSKQRK